MLKRCLGFNENDKIQFITSDPKLLGSCNNTEAFSDYNDFSNEDEDTNNDENNSDSNKFYTNELNEGCYVKITNNIDSNSYYFYKKCPTKSNILSNLEELKLLNNTNSIYGNLDSGKIKNFRLCGENPTDIIPINDLSNSLQSEINDSNSQFNVIPDDELKAIKIKFPDIDLTNFYYKDEFGKCHLPFKLKKYTTKDSKVILMEVNIDTYFEQMTVVVE